MHCVWNAAIYRQVVGNEGVLANASVRRSSPASPTAHSFGVVRSVNHRRVTRHGARNTVGLFGDSVERSVGECVYVRTLARQARSRPARSLGHETRERPAATARRLLKPTSVRFIVLERQRRRMK